MTKSTRRANDLNLFAYYLRDPIVGKLADPLRHE